MKKSVILFFVCMAYLKGNLKSEVGYILSENIYEIQHYPANIAGNIVLSYQS